jgi:hypothetical protein
MMNSECAISSDGALTPLRRCASLDYQDFRSDQVGFDQCMMEQQECERGEDGACHHEFLLRKLVTGESMDLDYNFYPWS